MRKKFVKQNRIFKLSLFKLLLPGLLLLIISGIVFLIRSNIFTISSVDVRLEKIGCADINQIKDSSKLMGQNFILLTSAKIERDLKNKFFCVRKVELSRYFPNKVRLFVSGREAAAILAILSGEEATASAEATPSAEASSSAQKLVVDNEGVIYSQNFEQISAPLLFVSGPSLSLGQKVQDNLIGNALKILEKLKSFGVDVKETKIYSRNVLLVNATPKIVFRLDGNINTQIASLQLILNKAKIDDESIEFMDLRFDKPVVRLAPKKR